MLNKMKIKTNLSFIIIIHFFRKLLFILFKNKIITFDPLLISTSVNHLQLAGTYWAYSKAHYPSPVRCILVILLLQGGATIRDGQGSASIGFLPN